MKLKNLLLTIPLALSVAGCRFEFKMNEYPIYPKYETNDVNGIIDYVSRDISYVSDMENYGLKEYLASPSETYERKKGDCEDYCILALYLLKRDLGVEGKMVVGKFDYGLPSSLDYLIPKHAWINVNGEDIEPQNILGIDRDKYYGFDYYSYSKVMGMLDG